MYFYCKSAKIKNLMNSSLLFCLAVNLRGGFLFYRKKHLGVFDNPDDAKKCYDENKNKHHIINK